MRHSKKGPHPMLVRLYEDYIGWKNGIRNIIAPGNLNTNTNSAAPDKSSTANKRRRMRGGSKVNGIQTTISTWANTKEVKEKQK